MDALQVHYTSCRRGQSASSGFQVRSYTPGVSPDELFEISRLGNYRPPNWAERPGDAHHYPVALRYTRLQSGRYALIHSCYSGSDYSGREGNFMAHTLVPEVGPLPVKPTDFLHWRGWKRRLTDLEDTDDSPPPLPRLDLDGIGLRSTDGPEFIAATPRGEAILADLMAASLLVGATSRRVVLRDPPDRGWRWIACLLDLIPPASVAELSISTYQFGPLGAADVNATVEGSEFSFSATQRDYEFFLFEPTAGVTPNLPDTNPTLLAAARRYAETSVDWYLRKPTLLAGFLAFMASFKPCRADGSLAAGLTLFEHLECGRDIGPEAFGEIRAFVKECATPEHWSRLVGQLVGAATSRPGRIRFDDLHELVLLCLDRESSGDGADLAESAYRAWFFLLSLALEAPNRYATRADQCWGKLAARFDPAVGYRELLSGEHLELLRSHYRRGEERTFAIVARYLVEAVRASARGNAETRELALAAMTSPRPRECLTALLSTLAVGAETADLFAYIGRRADAGAERLGILAECLFSENARHPEGAWRLRRRLYEQGLISLLSREFEHILVTGDKQKVFAAYMGEASAAIPGYLDSFGVGLAETYWSALDDRERDDQAWEWLGSRPAPALSRATLQEVAVLVDRRLSIDPRDTAGSAIAQRVSGLVAELGLDLKPNRSQIRRMLERLQTERSVDYVLADVWRQIPELAEHDYAIVVDLILRRKLPSTAGADGHRELVGKLYRQSCERAFVDAYGKAAASYLRRSKRDEDLIELVVAWVILQCLCPLVDKAGPPILDILAEKLAARREGDVTRILETLRMRFVQITSASADEEKLAYANVYSNFEEGVYRRSQSPMNSVRSIGRKLLGKAGLFRSQ